MSGAEEKSLNRNRVNPMAQAFDGRTSRRGLYDTIPVSRRFGNRGLVSMTQGIADSRASESIEALRLHLGDCEAKRECRQPITEVLGAIKRADKKNPEVRRLLEAISEKSTVTAVAIAAMCALGR
jgi:hypothetical protein